MKEDYRILGIAEDADEKTIKRAYFKLIRKYSPETDPDHFQEIRAAYERLTEKKEENPYQVEWEMPADPFAGKMLDQIQQLKESGNFHKAMQTAEEGIRYFGETEAFLFELARCCLLDGKTGKAVKGFEKLAKKYPDKIMYKGALAKAYFERGYEKKAIETFRQTYKMGWREPDFLLCYSQCCAYRNYTEEGIQVLEAMAADIGAKDNRKKQMMELLEAYTGMVALSLQTRERFPYIVAKCLEFLKSSLRFLDEYEDEVTGLCAAITLGAYYGGFHENKEVKEIRDLVLKKFPDASELFQQTGDFANFLNFMADERIGELMKWTVDTLMGEEDDGYPFGFDDEYRLFCQLDVMLCQMAEWPKQKPELELMKEEYPEFYEGLEELLGILQIGAEQRRFFREEMEIEYARLEKIYKDGRYYELHPERRADMSAVKWDSLGEGTYVRGGKKIGRNDPCPCGSGKKYKNCCMGKG